MDLLIKTKVIKLEEKTRIVRGWKNAQGEEVFETENLGWYISLEYSRESFYVGHEKPSYFEGQDVTVRISPCG